MIEILKFREGGLGHDNVISCLGKAVSAVITEEEGGLKLLNF